MHRELGPGFNESLYEEALVIELSERSIPFSRQSPIYVQHRGKTIGNHRLDLLVANCLVVELKAVEQLNDFHKAQVLSYLHATKLTLGLLINFHVPLLKQGIRRIIKTNSLGDLGAIGALAVNQSSKSEDGN